ncbi:dipeptide ABC transporter ATP-binding protein [Jatrophihabitans sp. DSM 45814]
MKVINQRCTAAPGARESDLLLCAENLTIRSGSGSGAKTLVQDASLHLGYGATLGIVGESGSGKTLTARSLVRLLPRGLTATGRVTFGGQSLLELSDRDMRRLRGSRISLLMQDPFTMLNPLQTIYGHIAESLAQGNGRSRVKLRSEVGRRLAEVGLPPDVMTRYPHQISGGMRQRAALAAALAGDPDLLIADEPTTALDVTTQDEVLTLLKQVQRQRGMGLIMITHDLRIAFSLCDTVEVMYAGSVVERGPARLLNESPTHPYSLKLLQADLPVTHYVARIPSIPGHVPPADAVASRCSFADRCDWREDLCVASRPVLSVVRADRWSACRRVDEIEAEMRQRRTERPQIGTPIRAEPKPGGPLASVRGICKTYLHSSHFESKRITVLDDVSFEIFPGESVGLVGETGSGKTTITRCLLGLTTADSGRIELAGINASDYGAMTRADRRRIRASVQVVFQDPYASLNPALTVGATLREACRLNSGTESVPTVDDLLNDVGLPAAYASRRPGALSGGERQRVAIARALALRPQLLLCDEPVASLDVSAQAQVLELLRDIRRERNMSMLFITHDLAVVRQMAERVIVLQNGKIVEEGDTDDVLDSSTHPYTKRLLAAVSRAPSTT